MNEGKNENGRVTIPDHVQLRLLSLTLNMLTTYFQMVKRQMRSDFQILLSADVSLNCWQKSCYSSL